MARSVTSAARMTCASQLAGGLTHASLPYEYTQRAADGEAGLESKTVWHYCVAVDLHAVVFAVVFAPGAYHITVSVGVGRLLVC